jgi:hypothetical protein
MRYNLIIILLFFYSISAYSSHSDTYSSEGAASNACDAYLQSIDPNGTIGYVCSRWSIDPSFGYYRQNSHYFNWTVGCAAGQIDDGAGKCVPQPSDQECIDSGIQNIKYQAKSPTGALQICVGSCPLEYAGCKFQSVTSDNNSYTKPVCNFKSDGSVMCDAVFEPISAANGQNQAVGENVELSGLTNLESTTTTNTTSSPETTQADTPNAGDTQTTKSETEQKNYTDSQQIEITSESVNVQTISGGNVETTTTTTTTNYSDGSTKTDITTTYTQTPINVTSEKANLTSGNTTTTTETTAAETGSTTTSTTTNSDGSSTTSTTETGSGGDGSGNADNRDNSSDDEFGDFNPTGSGDALYTRDDQLSVNSVLNDFKNDVFNTQLISSMTTFFDISISGQCPVWTIPAVWIFPSIPIDMQC